MFLLTIALAKGLVVLGLMLLLRAGLVSFGQALYYCIGAYTAGSLGRFFGISDMLRAAGRWRLGCGVIAFVLGFLLARYRGIFFGLLSLALSMILYGLLVKSEALGSHRRLQRPALADVRQAGPSGHDGRVLAGRACAASLHRRRCWWTATSRRRSAAWRRRSRTTRSGWSTWAPRCARRST